MKKYLTFIVLIASYIFMFGCVEEIASSDYIGEHTDSESGNSVSDASSFDASEEESRIPPEEIYEFLNSEYTVTSTRESFGTVYVCEYYFADGTVAGAKLMTTLPDEETAEEYFKIVLEDCPDASLDGFTVTAYLEDDEHYYYGYDLDKLKFVLEKSGYEYTVNFDEAVFDDEFYTSVAE